MDLSATLGINFRGGRNFILKKFVELEEERLAERINTLDDLEEDDFLEDVNDFEEGGSLSLAF